MQSADLQCDVIGLEYDFNLSQGRLSMASGDCCDMQGCVQLFEKIDRNVVRIETWAGRAPDTTYVTTYVKRRGRWSPENE